MESVKPKIKTKQIVRIDYRKLTNGDLSVFFRIYYKGKRWTITPGLYLGKDKKKNTEIRQRAEIIRSKLEVEIVEENYGLVPQHKRDSDFFEFFNGMAETKKTSKSNYGIWTSTSKKLVEYAGKDKLPFSQVTSDFLKGFQEFLLDDQEYKPKTVNLYYAKIMECFKKAMQKRIIRINPCNEVGNISLLPQPIVFLVLEELQKLWVTPCRNNLIKRAFLFCAWTGLRPCDAKALRWSSLSYTKELGYNIAFTQQKTLVSLHHPISAQAREFMGTEGKPDEFVFKGLNLSSTPQREAFKQWIADAGITKHITFYKSRHSYATLLLTYGSDFYTLSKLLGHTDINTAKFYANVIDPKKAEAANKLPNLK